MSTLHEQIKTLILEVKTKEALNLFALSGNKDAGLLKGRYHELMHEKSEDRISFADWLIHLNRIHFALLELTSPIIEAPKLNGSIQAPTRQATAKSKQMPPAPSTVNASAEQVAPAIRQAFQQGDLPKTFGLLLGTGEKEALFLHGKFNEAKRINALGMIDSETWMSLYTKIYKEILALDWMQQSSRLQTPSEEAKTQILQLLHEQKTAEALELCWDFGDPFLFIQARFATLQKLFEQGVFYPDFFEKSQKQITRDLQKLLEQETSKDDSKPKNRPSIQIDPAQRLSPQEAAPKIRQAMRSGDTEEAVFLFLRASGKHAELLYERCSDAAEEYTSGLLDVDEWGRIQAQLCYIILCPNWMRKTDSAQPISAQTKSQILQYLKKGEIKYALDLCEGSGDHFLLLQRRFEFAINQFSMGRIDFEYLQRGMGQINYGLLEMLERRSQNPSDFSSTRDFTLRQLLGKLPKQKESPSSWLIKIRKFFQ